MSDLSVDFVLSRVEAKRAGFNRVDIKFLGNRDEDSMTLRLSSSNALRVASAIIEAVNDAKTPEETKP